MQAPPEQAFQQRVGAVRRFSRFYTRRLGLLQDRFLESKFSLSQGRVLYELAQRPGCTATDIVAALALDHGYLSRILRDFEALGLITRKRAKQDGRQMVLSLTAKGHLAFGELDKRSQDDAGAMLSHLSEPEQARVVAAMDTIETLIAREGASSSRSCTLRGHRAGDMGWVVAKHGELYAKEYGWDSTIEAITAEIVAAFLKNFDRTRERCWIAEIDGETVGSIFLVRDGEREGVARIRLLIVDPKARGLGIGRDLVDRSIAFARECGYRSITLWTHADLVAARAIYERCGFRRTRQWVHEDFGKPLQSETWDLTL